MNSVRALFYCLITTAITAASAGPAVAAKRPAVESGKTQVVAKLNQREITLNDLRGEMARLGLSPNYPDAEKIALESIVNRALLADAARDANLHRQPAALRRMAVAQEQALADLYLSNASQPPEPTRMEIEEYITDNPNLFGERKLYEFSVLTMPTSAFDEKTMTPLFNVTEDFTDFASYLKKAGVDMVIAPAVQPSSAFPKPIREQLAAYGVRDNIVIQNDTDTQIMKIIAVSPAPVPLQDRPSLARQSLMQIGMQERAAGLVARLKDRAAVSYYRPNIAPTKNEAEGQ